MYKYTSIGEILKTKKFERVEKVRTINMDYEEAKMFLEYVGMKLDKRNIIQML